jgi:hypothetical protein
MGMKHTALSAQDLGDTVAIPELHKGDEILFVTGRGHCHAIRLHTDFMHVSKSDRGNTYITVEGYRIRPTDRVGFGNVHLYNIRADSIRKF